MDFVAEMQEGEEALRREEADSRKWGPPDGMHWQVTRINLCYLLYMLRLKARQSHYANWSRPENIKLEDADFTAMELLLQTHKDDVRKHPALEAYVRIISVLQTDFMDPDAPKRIEKVLLWVVDNRKHIDLEDFVFVTTYLSGYATTGFNKKLDDYQAIMLYSQIPAIEAKYGKEWSGKPFLPYRFITNLATAALNFAERYPWRSLPMELVDENGKSSTVYEWIEALLQAYESRLKKNTVSLPSLTSGQELPLFARITLSWLNSVLNSGNTLLKYSDKSFVSSV